MSKFSYPVGKSVEDALFVKLKELPNNEELSVPWFQKHVWPETSNISIPRDKVIQGMQANIFSVVLTNQNEAKTLNLIVKRVVPNELPPKASPEAWLDYLESVEREVKYYQSVPEEQDFLSPKCYVALQGQCGPDPIMDSLALLVLKDVSTEYYQTCAFNDAEMRCVLRGLANFHALNWKRKEVENLPRGGFWVLARRKQKGEIQNVESTWKSLLDRIPDLKEVVPNCSLLGTTLAQNAEKLDAFVESHCLTRIHGDAKAWNLFLPKDLSNGHLLLIDIAWTGKGHPFQDVAYVLTNSLKSELLEKMDDYVEFYINELTSYDGIDDTETLNGHHYDLVWLDYARVIVTGLWKSLSLEQIEAYQNLIGPSMINKSLKHAQFIIKRIHQKLMVQNVL